MTTAGPNNPNANPNQGPQIFVKDPADRYAQLHADWTGADQEHRASFEQNLENIKIVPSLIGNIAALGAHVSTTFQTDQEVNGYIVHHAVPTDTIYQTEGAYHHATHHRGHPSQLKRNLRHPLMGRSKKPAFYDVDQMNQAVYGKLVATGAPRGWKIRLDNPASPVSKFAMLSTGGQTYDVDWLKGARKVTNGRVQEQNIGLGQLSSGSNLWRYLPSIKVASAATNLAPTLENREALESHLTANAGPAWLMEPDPLKIIESYGPQWKNTLIDRLRMQGAMDTTGAEIAHLIAITNGLADLALNSGRYEGTF